MSYVLRDYQIDCINKVKELNKGDCVLVSLPTGSGKTIIFADIAANTEGRTLIVVPSQELREQTIDKLKETDSTLDIGSVQASLDHVENKIIVATRQSLTHKKSTRMERMLTNGEFEKVIIDEAHQAVDQIIKVKNKLNKNAIIIGFTATPFNSDMTKVFTKIICEKYILNMILENYLIEPRAFEVYSKTNLNDVKIVAGEFNQRQLEDTVNNIERNDLIVEAYKKYASDRKSTLVFASGIEHSRNLAEIFNSKGVYAKSIDSEIEQEERESIIEEFKAGKLPVLCNVGILTTGFDYKPTDCIMLCRPTKSKILYTQIIGRGLRLSPETDKKDCLIIDVQDVIQNHDLMSMSDAFEMKILHNETIREAIKRNEEEKIADKLKKQEEENLRIEKEQRRKDEMELLAREIKLFNRQADSHINNAYYDWYKCGLGIWVVSKDCNRHFVIEGNNDEFDIFLVCTEKENKDIEYLSTIGYIKDAIEFVEDRLHFYHTSYSQRDTLWKEEPPTVNQKKFAPYAKTKWDVSKYFTGNTIKTLLNKYHKSVA